MKNIAAVAILAGVAAAGPCNNNCGRQVIGTARASPALAERSSMCADFVTTTTTVTPPAVTETVAIYNRNVHARAAAPAITGEKPAYAANCANVEAYWNACQCFDGVKATTVTVTAPAPTETLTVATCSQGIEYAIYGVNSDAARVQNLYEAVQYGHDSVDFHLQFSGKTPDATGVSSTIGSIVQWVTDENAPVSLYGAQGPAGSTMGYGVVNHRGYLVPAVIGTYTIYLDTSDNAFYAWVGGNAISDWTPTNGDISRFWPPVEGESYSHSIEITESDIGNPIALRFLWFNYGGPGAFSARIIDPEGSTILGEHSVKNPQILSSCTGPEAVVPEWVAWADEL